MKNLICKKSRDEIFSQMITQSLIADKILSFENIYWESTLKYSEEHRGIREPRENIITLYTLLNNEKISVSFSRTFRGGTYIMAKLESDLREALEKEIRQLRAGEYN